MYNFQLTNNYQLSISNAATIVSMLIDNLLIIANSQSLIAVRLKGEQL